MKIFIILVISLVSNMVWAQNFTITGKISDVGQQRIVLAYEDAAGLVSDTVLIKAGKFQFHGQLREMNEPVLAMLKLQGSHISDNGYLLFYLEEGNTVLTGAIKDNTIAIKGGKTQQEYRLLEAELNSLKDSKELGDERRVAEAFIKRYPDSYVSYDLAVQHLRSLDSLASNPLINALSPRFHTTSRGKRLAKSVEIAFATAVGQPAPLFSQNNTEGSPVSLAAMRGKYVLIDFWASWCGPCRAENPYLVKAYKDFKNKNFEIIGVSLDKDKEAWLGAIKEDGLPWVNLCDLKGAAGNEVAKMYNIKAIPQNFLVDPNGIIVTRNLRGEDLEKKLEALLAPKVKAAELKFTEYDLPNGLHVILHQDKTAPVVAVSVMYHVGSKDEDPQRTGFAHFFEHLLFEGSENMKRGDFMKIVSSNGGQNNANTTQDRTYYYELFPSNQLELGLWLESERMLHPKIDEEGLRIQREVVKQEKRMNRDNLPYGKIGDGFFKHVFDGHPYSWEPIGSMAHLDQATLPEFMAFFKKYYGPNNAVLTIAGDVDIETTKIMVAKYFDEIPRGSQVVKPVFTLQPIANQIVDTVHDDKILVPRLAIAYRAPGMKSRDSKVLQMAGKILAGAASSRLNRILINEKKKATNVWDSGFTLEDYGVYLIQAAPKDNIPLNELVDDIDAEILRLQTELISESEFTKLQTALENYESTTGKSMLGIAERLASGYTYFKNTNRLNESFAEQKSIGREEIRAAAKKYLNQDQRVIVYYLPKK